MSSLLCPAQFCTARLQCSVLIQLDGAQFIIYLKCFERSDALHQKKNGMEVINFSWNGTCLLLAASGAYSKAVGSGPTHLKLHSHPHSETVNSVWNSAFSVCTYQITSKLSTFTMKDQFLPSTCLW